MKSKLLSGAASAALALGLGAPAYAQSPAISNWTGFYAGVHAGAAWGHANAATSSDCSATTNIPGYYCTTGGGAANAASVNASGTGKMSDTAFNGGFQAGYNWQANQFVFGVEGDIGLFRLNGSRQASSPYAVSNGAVFTGDIYNIGSTFETDWLATYRGRLGWAVNNWLFYVTGGGASTRLQTSMSFTDNNGATGARAAGSSSATKNGWVLGGGIEWMLSQNWTVKAEYLHVDFGSVTASGLISNPGVAAGYAQGIGTSTKLNADIVRAGINYKF